MKSIDEAEAKARFDEILDEAQRQSILIRRQGEDIAAVVSTADYQRLRAMNIQAFLELKAEIAGEATAAGLTEEGIAELLDRD